MSSASRERDRRRAVASALHGPHAQEGNGLRWWSSVIDDTNMGGLQLPPISDADLTEQALAADPGIVMPGAIPLATFIGPSGTAVLPQWYMPAPMPGGTHLVGWRRGVVFSFIASLVVIEAFGLCSTYGQLI